MSMSLDNEYEHLLKNSPHYKSLSVNYEYYADFR